MSLNDEHISLIDLSKQLPFQIDETLKNQLCFSEALLISCCHYDGEVVQKSDSKMSWTCSESTPSSKTSIVDKSTSDEFELNVDVSRDPLTKYSESDSGDDGDFHLFFYPKCPETVTATNSAASVLLVDGVPEVNLTNICKCKLDEFGKCICFKRLPCSCRPPPPKRDIPKKECTCKNRDTICSCNEIKCICETGKECVCQPGYCTCFKPIEIDPALIDDTVSSICGEDNDVECKCDVSETCICPPLPEEEKPEPICAEPEDCKCHDQCFCKYSVCDSKPKGDPLDNVCISLEKLINGSGETDLGMRKLKRVPASKEGFRWCHDVDSHHTYFDFGYGMQDKFEYQEKSSQKFVIQGLHEKKSHEEIEPLTETTLPEFKREIRKPSIDCCSAVGGITISIETLGETKDQFLVQVISHSSKEGAKTGTKLISIVDCNLHTMEESRVEYITKREVTKERRSYIALCDNGYYNKVSRACGGQHSTRRLQHSFKDARDFLLEGASVVLLRYIAIQRYRGNVNSTTAIMNGTICESLYRSHGVTSAVVNGKPMHVVKVDRYVMEKNGTVYQTLTVLTLKGYTVSHEWADSAYIVHLNPLLNVIPEHDEIEEHAPLRSTWRQDLQLLSDYLDFKAERSSEGARYISENGELAGAVCDYLQALLLMQPKDTLLFTRQYFGAALSTLDLPHNEYFDPEYNALR